MAGDDGFEPPLLESKSSAFTTWRIPKGDADLSALHSARINIFSVFTIFTILKIFTSLTHK